MALPATCLPVGRAGRPRRRPPDGTGPLYSQMDCYACDQEAAERCSRCGNSYCRDHGADPSAGSPSETSESARRTGQVLCADCLDPVNAAPSATVFRASVFALLAASVLALWLLVRPPSLPGESSEVGQPRPSPAASPASPAASPSPRPSASATPLPSATATPSPAAPTPIEYTVVEDDTLSGIAEAFGVSAEDLAAVNGLDINDPILHPGDVLIIPQP